MSFRWALRASLTGRLLRRGFHEGSVAVRAVLCVEGVASNLVHRVIRAVQDSSTLNWTMPEVTPRRAGFLLIALGATMTPAVLRQDATLLVAGFPLVALSCGAWLVKVACPFSEIVGTSFVLRRLFPEGHVVPE